MWKRLAQIIQWNRCGRKFQLGTQEKDWECILISTYNLNEWMNGRINSFMSHDIWLADNNSQFDSIDDVHWAKERIKRLYCLKNKKNNNNKIIISQFLSWTICDIFINWRMRWICCFDDLASLASWHCFFACYVIHFNTHNAHAMAENGDWCQHIVFFGFRWGTWAWLLIHSLWNTPQANLICHLYARECV